MVRQEDTPPPRARPFKLRSLLSTDGGFHEKIPIAEGNQTPWEQQSVFPDATKQMGEGAGRVHVLHALTVRPLTTRPREDGALFL